MEYQNNSRRKREEDGATPPEKKVMEKIVVGEVVIKPPGFGRKLKGIFFGGEFRTAARGVVSDVLLPAARNVIVEATTKGIERVVFGDSPVNRGRRPEMRSRIQYHTPFNRPFQTQSSMLPGQPPHFANRVATKESNSILIASRNDADNVLTTLVECVAQYGVVSLADLYELLGKPVAAVDHNWGWTYLNTAEIRQVRDGWMLELPPMEEIKWA